MDSNTLLEILSDQREELVRMKAERFCERKEEAQINLSSKKAQVVIGVRRSGKSTLCFNALSRSGVKFAYVNFDDERFKNITSDDLNEVLRALYQIYGNFTHLFMDEVQNIREWYLFVNRLLRQGLHIVITGSNANLLSGELSTHLTGRHHSIELFPFSFAEYCEVRGIDRFTQSTKADAFRSLYNS